MRRFALIITVLLAVSSPSFAGSRITKSGAELGVSMKYSGSTESNAGASSGRKGGFQTVVTGTRKVVSVRTVIENGHQRKVRVTSTFAKSTPSRKPTPPKPIPALLCPTGTLNPASLSSATIIGFVWHTCSDGRQIRVPVLCYSGFQCLRPGRQRQTQKSPSPGRATVNVRKIVTTQIVTETSIIPAATTIVAPNVEAMVDEALRKLPVPEPVTSPPLWDPAASGVVGVPFFYAVPEEQWKIVAPSVSRNGATVTIVATPVALVFDSAETDEADAPCFTPGARVLKLEWARAHPRAVCAHTYQSSSPNGLSYQGSLSIRWKLTVEAEGIDQDQIDGQIPEFTDTTTELLVPITEIQAVLR